MWMHLKHLARLSTELYLNARTNRSWGLFVLMVLLLAMTAFIVMGQTAAPFIYTIF